MFTFTKLMNEAGPSAAALGAAMGDAGTPAPDAAPLKAADVFDAAKEKFFSREEDDPIATEDPNGEEPSEDGATDEESEGEEPAKPEWTEESGKQKPAAEPFKPYVFNGKVFGKDQVAEFKSQKELDATIARGLAAPTLYKTNKDLKAKIAELTPEAEYGRDLVAMAKENPKDLLNLLRDELIPEEVLADWVYEAYNEFSKIAKMSPEERERQNQIREAQRIIEERKYLQQENDRLAKQREEAAAEQEKKDFERWRNTELTKWESKIPGEYRESISKAMKAVAALAKSRLDAGEKVSFREMSKELESILTPMMHAKSPGAQRREAGKAMEAKKNQATQVLQGATKMPSRPSQPQGTPIKRAEDVFDRFAAMVAGGRAKLKQ